MGKTRIEVTVGAFRSTSDGPGHAGPYTVLIENMRSRAAFDNVWAVIDAPERCLGQLRIGIVAAFEPGGTGSTLIAGSEESYLDSVLDRLTLEVTDHASISIAICIRTNQGLTLASLGGAAVRICRSEGHIEDIPADCLERPQGARIWQTTFGAGDSIILGGRQISAHVVGAEVKQTVQAGFSIEHASQWLTTLATTRGQKPATALIARARPEVERDHRPSVGAPSRPHMLLPRPARAAITVALVLTLLVTMALSSVFILGAAFPGQSTIAAQPTAPDQLQVPYRQPHSVMLSWEDSSPGAVSFNLLIAGQNYSVTSPFKRLDNVLAPGRSYSWRVQAIFQGGRSLSSKPGRVQVPISPALPIPLVSSPGLGPFQASQAKSIAFCWTAKSGDTTFQLDLSGGGTKYGTKVLRASGSDTGLCIHRSLKSAESYAWRLGAWGPGYRGAWTDWKHFVIAAVPTPTPMPTPTSIPYIPESTQVPAYNSSTTYSQSSTGYTTSPGYSYGSGATTSPPVSEPTQAPAPAPTPTSGDLQCTTPPNC